MGDHGDHVQKLGRGLFQEKHTKYI
jgi:hypothetical protein